MRFEEAMQYLTFYHNHLPDHHTIRYPILSLSLSLRGGLSAFEAD